MTKKTKRMIFTAIIKIIKQKWPNLYKVIRERNISGENSILTDIHRKDVQQDRNDRALRMITSINPWQQYSRPEM